MPHRLSREEVMHRMTWVACGTAAVALCLTASTPLAARQAAPPPAQSAVQEAAALVDETAEVALAASAFIPVSGSRRRA